MAQTGLLAIIRDNYSYAVRRSNIQIWVILSVLLAFAGPFGTYELYGFGYRLFYWSSVVVISSIIGIVIFRHVPRLVPRNRPLMSDVLSTLLMTAVFTPIATALTRWLIVPPGEAGPGLMDFGSYVLGITTAVALFRRMLPGSRGEGTYLPGVQQLDPPRLMRRLPDEFDGDILRLSARDHFVDVVTTDGTFSIRMRLSDAIDEMDSVSGFCTHRSHWVSLSAARSVQNEGGRTVLELRNGEFVPVSRKYKPELESFGFAA